MIAIASQCPMTGGNSVMTARALYALFNPDNYYDDRALCLLDGITLKQAQHTTAKPKSRLFPNPANESATLEYNLTGEAPAVLRILNYVGQVVLRFEVNASATSFKFRTHQLMPGVYYVNLRQQSETIDNLKLVIIR